MKSIKLHHKEEFSHLLLLLLSAPDSNCEIAGYKLETENEGNTYVTSYANCKADCNNNPTCLGVRWSDGDCPLLNSDITICSSEESSTGYIKNCAGAGE